MYFLAVVCLESEISETSLTEEGMGNSFRPSGFVMHFSKKLEAQRMTSYAGFDNRLF